MEKRFSTVCWKWGSQTLTMPSVSLVGTPTGTTVRGASPCSFEWHHGLCQGLWNANDFPVSSNSGRFLLMQHDATRNTKTNFKSREDLFLLSLETDVIITQPPQNDPGLCTKHGGRPSVLCVPTRHFDLELFFARFEVRRDPKRQVVWLSRVWIRCNIYIYTYIYTCYIHASIMFDDILNLSLWEYMGMWWKLVTFFDPGSKPLAQDPTSEFCPRFQWDHRLGCSMDFQRFLYESTSMLKLPSCVSQRRAKNASVAPNCRDSNPPNMAILQHGQCHLASLEVAEILRGAIRPYRHSTWIEQYVSMDMHIICLYIYIQYIYNIYIMTVYVCMTMYV